MNSLNLIDRMQQHFIDCNNNQNHTLLGPMYAQLVGAAAISAISTLIVIKLALAGVKEFFGKLALGAVLIPVNLVRRIGGKESLTNPCSIERGVNFIGQAYLLGIKTPRIVLVNLIDPNLVTAEKELGQARNEITQMRQQHTQLSQEIANLRNAGEQVQTLQEDNAISLQKAHQLLQEKKAIEAQVLSWNQALGGSAVDFSLELMDSILEQLNLQVKAARDEQANCERVNLTLVEQIQELGRTNASQTQEIADLQSMVSNLSLERDSQNQQLVDQLGRINQLMQQVSQLQEQLKAQNEPMPILTSPVREETEAKNKSASTDSKTEEDMPPIRTVVIPVGNRGNLLDQIRKGTSLKRISEEEKAQWLEESKKRQIPPELQSLEKSSQSFQEKILQKHSDPNLEKKKKLVEIQGENEFNGFENIDDLRQALKNNPLTDTFLLDVEENVEEGVPLPEAIEDGVKKRVEEDIIRPATPGYATLKEALTNQFYRRRESLQSVGEGQLYDSSSDSFPIHSEEKIPNNSEVNGSTPLENIE